MAGRLAAGKSPLEWGGMGGVCRLGAGMPPYTGTSTHRAQDFTEHSRAIEHFIKQKKTSVCRPGTLGKSGKRVGCASHKSGPAPSQIPCRDEGFLIRNIFPPPQGTRRKQASDWGQGAPRGTPRALEAWSSCRESGRWSAPPQRRTADLTAHLTKDWGTQY